MQTIVLALTVPLALAMGLLVAWFYPRRSTLASFVYADRNIDWSAGSVMLAVCWLWVFSLVVGPAKAYAGGIGPLVWFAGSNSVAMLAFAILATRLYRLAPFPTFTGFIRMRYGAGMLAVYTLGITGMMTYAVWANLTGALDIFLYAAHAPADAQIAFGPVAITMRNATLICMVLGMIAIAWLRGMQSSASADLVKSFCVVAVIAIGLLAIVSQGSQIHAGVRGVSGTGPSVFSWELVRDFGFPVALSLISGITIDVQMWQRVFSLKLSAARLAPWLAVPIFGTSVFLIGGLGIVAAARGSVVSPSLAGFVAIDHLVPYGANVFMVMIAAALLATGAAALHAASVSWAVDVLRRYTEEASERTTIWLARLMMVCIAIVGIGIAQAGITLEQMLLAIGTFRGALLVPTWLAILYRGPAASGRFTVGVLACMVLGPIVAYRTSVFTAGVAIVLTTLVLCVLEIVRSVPKNTARA